MKTIRRLIIATLSLAILMSSLAIFGACGSHQEVVDDESTIQVQILEGGYGKEWFNKCCNAFKQKHPEVNFDITWDLAYGGAETILKAGPNVTKTDLFFGGELVIKFALYGDSFLRGYDCIFEDLSEVYNSKIEGENITIKEKMIEGFADAYSLKTENSNGTTTKYYCFPWVTGVMGLVYNATQFEQMGLRVPRTTDELFDVTCKTIKDNGKIPFVASKDNTYDYSLWDVWQTQYYSIEGMDLYWQCKVKDNSDALVYSEDARKGIGELRYLSAIEKMLSPEYGNMHPNVNTLTFTQAQAQLLLGNAMMYYCGDWLESEMKNSRGNGDTLKYMKTPILSGIIDKTPTINDDLTLRAVISYIDGEDGVSVPAGVSEEDIAYIRQARDIESLATHQAAYIPAYAKAKEKAKEFLKFLATEEAIKICLDETGGSSLPFKLDGSKGYNVHSDSARWNSYSEFIKSKYEMLDSVKQSPLDKNTYPLNLFGALKINNNAYALSYAKFTAKNPKDRITAQQIYNDRKTFFTYEKLMTALERAGIV